MHRSTYRTVSLSESVDVRGSAPESERLAADFPDELRRAVMLEHPTLAVAAVEQGRIRAMNGPWKALFAMPPDVSAEPHVAALFPNVASADRFERGLQGELLSDRGPRATARIEHMLMRRDGQAFLAEVVVSCAQPAVDSGALSGDALWQVRDITGERTLRHELRELEDYHRELSRQQRDVTFVIDRKGRISYVSGSVEPMLGYEVTPLLGQPFSSLLHPSQVLEADRWLRSQTRRAAASRGATDAEGFRLTLLHGEGGVRSLACVARDCFAVPAIAGMIVHAHDLAAVDAASAAAAALRVALLEVAKAVPGDDESGVTSLLASVAARADATLVVWWRTVDGESRPVAISRLPVDDAASDGPALPPLIAAEDVSEFGPFVIGDVAKQPGIDAAAFADAAIGALIQVPLFEHGVPSGWLVVGAGESRRWSDPVVDFVVGAALVVGRAAKALRSPARPVDGGIDSLTGLPDRSAAMRFVAGMLDAIEPGEHLVAIAIGVDRLRDVNDRLGLAAGDAVLVQSAGTIRHAAGQDAFVARTGGDEFLVVLRGMPPDRSDAAVQALIDASDIDGTGDARVGMSVGVAEFAFDGINAADFLLQADHALREAKRSGGGEVFVYHHRLATQLQMRRELDLEIETALAKDQFTVFYQPQVDLMDGRVVGIEALLRWQHPTRGLLLPSAFIHLAFGHGLHDAITKWVLAQVCEQLSSWRRAGDVPEVPVAVNVEGRQFHDRRLPALVASALLKSGLPARLLLLDVKEQSLATDDGGMERVVRELSRLGVRVVVSDFSVGHSSFRALRKLQVAQIKLDRGFVGGLPDDQESALVVASFVALAHQLQYSVVAEGVETRAQCDFLRTVGCQAGQGFYLGHPLSAADIRPLLSVNRLPDAV